MWDAGAGLPELRGNAGRTWRERTGRGPPARVAEASGLGADATAARAQGAGRGAGEPAPFVRPPRPLRPLASRLPPGPCPCRAGLRGPAARAPALVLFGFGEEGQLFPGRAPPPQRVPARMRRRAPRRLIGCEFAHALRPVARLPARPPLRPLSTVFQPVRKMPAVVTGCGGPAPPGSPPPPRPRPPLRSSQW